MDNKENRGKKFMPSCMSKGPGPVYNIPTLIGYNGHDPSRYRYPAYTIPGRHGDKSQTSGPGPQYNVARLTNYGIDNPPAYTLRTREKFKALGFGPGPGAYYPESVPPMNHCLRPPAYTIKTRSMEKMSGDGPGPNVYVLPSCLGPHVPDKTAQGAFTIIGRTGSAEKTSGPGPAAYADGNWDMMRKKYPAYSLKSRQKSFGVPTGPGPVYYPTVNIGKTPPKYSFGVRHSECVPPAITEYDD